MVAEEVQAAMMVDGREFGHKQLVLDFNKKKVVVESYWWFEPFYHQWHEGEMAMGYREVVIVATEEKGGGFKRGGNFGTLLLHLIMRRKKVTTSFRF